MPLGLKAASPVDTEKLATSSLAIENPTTMHEGGKLSQGPETRLQKPASNEDIRIVSKGSARKEQPILSLVPPLAPPPKPEAAPKPSKRV